jgi:endo-1,4-beta-xylanase
MTTSIKIYLGIIILVLLASLAMLLIRKYRKAGLLVLGTLISMLLITGFWIFHPKHYDRKYLDKSAEWKNLRIRQYADSLDFYLGAIPGGTDIADPLFCENFNSVTPENALKMGPLLRNKKIGDYDFSYADKIVNLALENNLRVRGHTLVWGKQSDMFKNPDLGKWLDTFPENERSPKLKELMSNHITTVLNHFRGRIKIWDCVNEPTSLYRKGEIEDNVYMKYLGEDYIADAFKLAHSADSSLKLFLNEELSDYNDKQADCFAELVRKLKNNNIPISGVGIQSHILAKTDTAIVDLQNYIKKFTDMGLEVEITELDMRLRIFDAADDPYFAQGKYYARLIEACMSNPLCKGVSFWGFSDGNCWIDHFPLPKPNEPYFFDSEMNPKPAFYEVYKFMKGAYERRKNK